jgi:hypothetical protein
MRTAMTTLAAMALLAGCYGPKLKNFGFSCDPQAIKPCPDGYFCNMNFCDDGSGGTPPQTNTGGNGDEDMAMSGAQDMAMASVPDMAKATPPDMVVVSSCAHDECSTGAKLSKTCSACATAVCNKDSLCCSSSTIGWDSTCVSEVNQYCTTKTCP